MKDLPQFLYKVASFFRWLVIVIIVLLAWVFAIQGLKAQDIPFVRVKHDAFISYYDLERHNPALVVYELQFAHFAGNVKASGRHFKMDTQLPRPRVKDGDFRNSGYVRGHLCSAGDRDSNKKWLKETYLTSNLVPMTMVCNSGSFKMIEDSCRALAMAGHRLRIGRFPLYSAGDPVIQVRGLEHVSIAIPDGFGSVAVCLDCGLKYFDVCKNLRSGQTSDVIRFMNDFRVGLLLNNIFGSWSQEEYETITR